MITQDTLARLFENESAKESLRPELYELQFQFDQRCHAVEEGMAVLFGQELEFLLKKPPDFRDALLEGVTFFRPGASATTRSSIPATVLTDVMYCMDNQVHVPVSFRATVFSCGFINPESDGPYLDVICPKLPGYGIRIELNSLEAVTVPNDDGQ